ncbi:hypothetical protein DMENIID0001_168010 [Sergentomyia squamirostris]
MGVTNACSDRYEMVMNDTEEFLNAMQFVAVKHYIHKKAIRRHSERKALEIGEMEDAASGNNNSVEAPE